MPINEQQAEQHGSWPSIAGLEWPSTGDEPSGAGQSLDAARDQSRAEQSGLLLQRHGLPGEYLEASGGWTHDAPPSLMDMLIRELIPQPSEEALDLVNYAPSHQPTAPFKLLVAAAITVLQQAEDRLGASTTGFAVDELRNACHRGAMLLITEDLRSSGRSPIAASIPIVRRPNEAARFA